MAIPELSRQQVVAALERIDTEGVPPRRAATGYHLVYGDRRYPPKYVVSLAVEIATGQPLEPSAFSGGDETNEFLRRLGFEIVDFRCEPAEQPRALCTEFSTQK